MRNFLFIVTVIVIFLISFVCGYYIYRENFQEELPQKVITEIADATIRNNLNTFTPSLLTSTIDEKVSPNATLVIKKYYKECGHTTKDYAEILEELVNMNEEEVKSNLPDWEIKGFSPDEIVLYKELAGICNEHYVLREKGGNVAIYLLDANENEKLSEITEISTEYLTEQDLKELKEGIRTIGKEELNSLLEDYE